MKTVTQSIESTSADTPSSVSAGPSPPDGLRAWIVKATGILLVVPALVNAGYDVYAAALKLPRTDAEKVNTEMFKKYFNKTPLATLPVPVKSSVGTVEAKFAIYEEGEIYVEFGKYSQWFPFPKSDQPKRVSFSLISSAQAQPAPRIAPYEHPAIASQTEVINGDTLTRSRICSDGRTERRQIDIRSGSTLSVDFGKVGKESVPTQRSPSQTIHMDAIDLHQLRAAQAR